MRARGCRRAARACLARGRRPLSDDGRIGEGRIVTRRGFVFGLGALAVGLITYNPRLAYADEPWWDGSLIFRGRGSFYGARFWSDVGVVEAGSGAKQSGDMYTDLSISAKTPWVEWDISSRPFIRAATKITIA